MMGEVVCEDPYIHIQVMKLFSLKMQVKVFCLIFPKSPLWKQEYITRVSKYSN
jgi:hypothetical protein